MEDWLEKYSVGTCSNTEDALVQRLVQEEMMSVKDLRDLGVGKRVSNASLVAMCCNLDVWK
jgi:hypothetical protein